MPKSKYQIIKEGWGSRPNFQASYGLTMSPDDIEEGNRILEALMEHDEDENGGRSNEKAEHKGVRQTSNKATSGSGKGR